MAVSRLFHSFFKTMIPGKSLAVQCLILCAPTAGDVGSIPGWGIKSPVLGQPKCKTNSNEKKNLGLECWVNRERSINN